MVGISFLSLASGISAFLRAAVLVVGIYEGSHQLEHGGVLQKQEVEIILATTEAHGFTGEFASLMPIIITPDEKTVLLVGLGKESDLSDLKAMELGGTIYSNLEKIKAAKAMVIAPQNIEARLAYGAMLKSYKFNKYFSKKRMPMLLK